MKRKWLRTRRIGILVSALAFGLVVGAAASATVEDEPVITIPFEGVDQRFCPDGAPIIIAHSLVDEHHPGWQTPEAARDAFLNWRKLPLATGALSAELSDELDAALLPLADLDAPVKTKISDDVYYFDKLSDKPGFLDVRLVAERGDDGFFIVRDFICNSQVVDDDAWAVYEEAVQNAEVTR